MFNSNHFAELRACQSDLLDRPLKVVDASAARAQPREAVERIGLNPLDYGGSERDEIRKRVENFRKHQDRFSREREEYAASILRTVNPILRSDGSKVVFRPVASVAAHAP